MDELHYQSAHELVTALLARIREHNPAVNAIVTLDEARALEQAKEAGAIILGKTNVPVYTSDLQSYNKLFGVTNNPHNADHTPGGSSGGAAAALAAGMTPLEVGSDLAGSIRIPAHFCGVFGHKPSRSLVSFRGHIPGPPGTDLTTIGFARLLEDAGLAGFQAPKGF